MLKTEAYEELGNRNPLTDLITRTNEMLKGLLTGKHIKKHIYEKLRVDPNESELAHLYFLPKAHKPGTPLRPIVAGIKSPTIGISRWLDRNLRPLFNKMAEHISVLNGTQLISRLETWSITNLQPQTLFLTMDVSDLYTMIPQEGGVQAIKKMLQFFKIDKIKEVKTPIILLLARYVMKNNFFIYNNVYYKQTRGGAMGSPLTLTLSNTYMFFFERPIVKWATHNENIYHRYIDDIFIACNATNERMQGLIQHWNRINKNIKMTAEIGSSVNFLDVSISNRDGKLHTTVFHKPSHEPYFLPFDSTHKLSIKKNIPYGAIIRAIRYSCDITSFCKEETHITMALLLNGYPLRVIHEQYQHALHEMNCKWPNKFSYERVRQTFLEHYFSKEELTENREKDAQVGMYIHFSYCEGMHRLSATFHEKWNTILGNLAISSIKPIIGFRNCASLQQRLVKKKPAKPLITS
jgi:hypothetical protein